MRIALVRAKYDPFGGAERFVETAVHALADAGVSLTIFTRAWPANANPAIAHRIVNPRYLTSLGRDKSFARAVCRALADDPHDLVQAHERIACCDIYRAGDGVHAEWLHQRARASGLVKRATTALNPHHRYLLQAERTLFTSTRLKAVICNSRMVRDEIARHFGTDRAKLHVIYSGVDSDKFSPEVNAPLRSPMRSELGIADNQPAALFVGSGFERKGLGIFLQAVARERDLFAVVVGKDKQKARYQALARELGLSGRVHFAGGVQDVRPYYAAADLFVLPTLYDPFPNACLEAFASGLPVVTSRSSGAAELVQAGVNGFVTDARDIDAIAKAMRDCVGQPAMEKAARETVAALTPAAMAAQYLALYRTLLAR